MKKLVWLSAISVMLFTGYSTIASTNPITQVKNTQNKCTSFAAQIPSWSVYPAGEYAKNGLCFSVNMYTSFESNAVGVIYTFDNNNNLNNSSYMYEVGTNIYDMVSGTLDGCQIGFTQNSMIVLSGDISGTYPKTQTYSAP